MSKNEKNIELLDQFINGQLDTTERNEVSKRLEQDLEFAKELDQLKLMVDCIRISGRKKLLDEIKHWDEDLPDVIEEPDKVKKLAVFRWYYAAASIVLFMVAGFLIYSNINFGYEKIVAEVYEPYDYTPSAQRGGEVQKNSLSQFFNYYDLEEYASVIQLWVEIDEAEKTVEAEFFLANAYQAEKRFLEASVIFRKLVKRDNSNKMASMWYLALCYLSLDNPEQARELLDELENKKSSYSPKAQKLLVRLNE